MQIMTSFYFSSPPPNETALLSIRTSASLSQVILQQNDLKEMLMVVIAVVPNNPVCGFQNQSILKKSGGRERNVKSLNVIYYFFGALNCTSYTQKHKQA